MCLVSGPHRMILLASMVSSHFEHVYTWMVYVLIDVYL